MKKHLKFIDSLICLRCGNPSPTHHHLLRVEQKYLEPKKGTENFLIPKYNGRGMAQKNPDCFTVPLCPRCHSMLHMSGNERAFMEGIGVYKPEELALELFENSGDREKALKLIKWLRVGNVSRR